MPKPSDGLSVVCLRTGDAYGDEYVLRLRNMVAGNLGPHRFICFTDRPIAGIDCVHPPCQLPGWWGKVGFFRPDLLVEGPFLYLDLDVLVTGSLDPLCGGSFRTIRQMKRIRAPRTVPLYNSSAMYFPGPGVRRQVWDQFAPGVMRRFRGDQDWLAHVCPDEETFPASWVALMERCADGPPPGARLVLCNAMDNHVAASRHPWVRDLWT